MADGKLLTKGLKKDFSGDVDLFGHEEQPNLQDLRQYWKSNWNLLLVL